VAVLKPRERLVYFRISEDEFHQFVNVCEREGARSVSDLARSAVKRLIADCNQHREDQDLAPKVQMLEKLIAELTAQLQLLDTLLKKHGQWERPLVESRMGAIQE
jgi:DNA-binding transcriptional regulator GbsR (MarR family)